MDRLRAMAVFVEVAEAGSLSAAARHLGEPLTNISRLLSQLEEHLGVTLVDRTTRRMILTHAGREYLKACRGVLEALESAQNRIAGQTTELSGEIAITAPVSFGRLHVLPVIAEFLAAYPRINTRLILVDRVVDLLEEDLDVAVRIGKLPDSALLAMRVGSLRLVTCASPRYLERGGTPSTINDLANHDCVTFAGVAAGQRWIFKSARHGRKSVRVRARLSVTTAEAAVEAAIASVGITRVFSYQARAALEAGLLKPILERFEETSIPIHLVYRSTRADTPRVQEFVRFAAERFRAQRSLR